MKAAAKDGALLKNKELYKVTKRKPLFIDDLVYAVESDVNSRETCKLYGEAIHIMKKQAVVVFVKPGNKISKKIEGADLNNVSCIYRYNFSLKKYTQVLMPSEFEANCPLSKH